MVAVKLYEQEQSEWIEVESGQDASGLRGGTGE